MRTTSVSSTSRMRSLRVRGELGAGAGGTALAVSPRGSSKATVVPRPTVLVMRAVPPDWRAKP
ncbi:hypothetical protein DK27_13960 [Xanthomonas arboricola pv. pruni]|nr:hypothetical protein DK27_13960 [Xanthomonas arboricola pv. pruni]